MDVVPAGRLWMMRRARSSGADMMRLHIPAKPPHTRLLNGCDRGALHTLSLEMDSQFHVALERS